MKRLLLLGLLASPSVWAVYEPAKLPDPSRRWAVTLNTRGEFDDNINTDETGEESSFKAIVEPQFLVNYPSDQTFVGFRYGYRAVYFEERSSDPVDQSHTVDLTLSHTVSPKLQIDLRDQLRRGIEPEIVEEQAGDDFVRRRRGDFLYNSVNGGMSYNLTPRWTGSVRGGWDHWEYDDAAASENDRDVYRGSLAANYSIDRRTSGGIGYQFAHVAYDAAGPDNQRNSDSHVGYLTAVRRFNPQLSGQANVGVELREFGDGASDVGPWVDASVTYNYGPQNSAMAGFRYSITTTEVGTFRSADSADIFGQVTHRLTTKLNASGSVTYSLDTFSNPSIPIATDNLEEQTLSVGLTLRYRFTRWFSGDAGYNFDRIESDVAGRDFTRNRVSLGCRLEY